MTKSRQRLFIADSLPISRGVPAQRLRRRCPFGRPRNILRFNVFRSDSPLLLRSVLWLSLSRGWLCGLVCSLDSEGTPLVIGCSNFLGCAVQLEFRRARVGGCAVVLRHRIALCTGLSVAEVELCLWNVRWEQSRGCTRSPVARD